MTRSDIGEPAPSEGASPPTTIVSPPTTRERARQRVELLARLARNPVLLTQYSAHMGTQRARTWALRRTYERRVATPRHVAKLVPATIALGHLEELPPPLREPAMRIRREAEAILHHRFELLGWGEVQLGEEIDWHVDFESGYRWPATFYLDLEATRLTDSSDAKVPWELSRCHHLLTLARAARIFDDRRYADELAVQLEQWMAANRPGYGINWANPMEVAFRAVNWIAAISTLEPWRPLEDPLRAEVVRSLQVHGRHIATNLEGNPYLRSNHFLANILGLLVLGASLDGDPRAERWLSYAHRAFEREILSQVDEDGVGFEASLPYHGLALEMLLVAKTVASRLERPFSRRFDRRLERMLDASRALRHPEGRLPQFGDSDSGRVLPAGFERHPTIDNLLFLGAAVLDQERPLEAEPHEEVAWTLGLGAWARLADRPVAAPAQRSAFRASGLYVLRGEGAHAVARCGHVGQNGNGGHAHNDVASFELSYRIPVVVDSGTYVYTSDPEARNLFRSTAAHNTVVVGEAEINPIVPAALFRLKQFARENVELWEETADRVRLVVSHDGYRRLEPPLVHRRSFTVERPSGALDVSDELLGTGAQRARSLLHLAPEVDVVALSDDVWELRCDDVVARASFRGFDEVRVVGGWVSNRFGERERGQVLVGVVSDLLPITVGYRLEPAAGVQTTGPAS